MADFSKLIVIFGSSPIFKVFGARVMYTIIENPMLDMSQDTCA